MEEINYHSGSSTKVLLLKGLLAIIRYNKEKVHKNIPAIGGPANTAGDKPKRKML